MCRCRVTDDGDRGRISEQRYKPFQAVQTVKTVQISVSEDNVLQATTKATTGSQATGCGVESCLTQQADAQRNS